MAFPLPLLGEGQGEGRLESGSKRHSANSSIVVAPSACSTSLRRWSRFSSAPAPTTRKKRSQVARSIPFTAKIGWQRLGIPQKTSKDTKPAIPAQSTPNSKGTRRKTGQLLSGRPPEFIG